MADIYSLFAGEEPTREEQARALAAALRGQRGLGSAFTLDPLMARTGGALLADARDQEEMLASAGKQRAANTFQALLAQKNNEAELERAKLRERGEWGRLKAQLAAKPTREAKPPDLKTVETEQGIMIFNPETGELKPAPSVNGRPLRSAATAEKERTEATKKREKMEEVDARTNTIRQNIKLLREQIGGPNGTGTFELFGPENNIYNTRVSDIATDLAKLKDPTSSAQAGEVEREKAAIGLEPSFFQSANTQMAVLDELDKAAEARRQEAYRVRGLALPTNGGPEPRPGETAVPVGSTRVRIRDVKTGRMGWAASRAEIPQGAEEVL
jgi:hypothetical protein